MGQSPFRSLSLEPFKGFFCIDGRLIRTCAYLFYEDGIDFQFLSDLWISQAITNEPMDILDQLIPSACSNIPSGGCRD